MQEFLQSAGIDASTAGAVLFSATAACVFIAGCLVDLTALVRIVRRPPDWDFFSHRLQLRPWSWRNSLPVLLLLPAVHALMLAAMELSRRVQVVPREDLLPVAIVVQSTLFHGLGFLLTLWILRSEGMSWRLAFGFDRSRFWHDVSTGVLCYLGAMPLVAAASFIYRIYLDRLGISSEAQDVIRLLTDPSCPAWLRVYVSFLGLAAAPVVEEMLFRGMAMPLVLRACRPASAIVLVSLFFAILHFHVPSFVPLFMIAAAFSFGYLISGSLTVPIVMHICFNGVNLAGLLLVHLLGKTT